MPFFCYPRALLPENVVSDSNKKRWPIGRKLLVLPPVVIGVVVLAFMAKNRTPPQQVVVTEVARKLRVIEVPQVSLVPRVVGYGTAQPADVWTAVSEVKGRILETHPELKAGAIIHAGEMVLQIDPAEYELQIAQLRAEIAEVESQQQQLDAEEKNYLASVEIEQASLNLANRDLTRLRSLRSSNSVTESEVESKQREVLTQQQSVQSLNNSLNIVPAQRQSLTALLDAKRAKLELAQLDLDHATIKAPFDCRLSEVSLEKGQFLPTGKTLFEAHGTTVTEVSAQFPIDQIRTLLTSKGKPINIPLSGAMELMREIFDVQATVRMKTGDFQVEWTGRFDRIREQLDIQTRTLGVIIAVDRPYDNVIPGQRPPLAPGMFCEVELRGQPRTGQMVVPRVALHEGHVYLVNEEDRLERRRVEVLFSQGGFSCISSGLNPGERLVVSDPTPGIEGMKVIPTPDTELEQSLVAETTGEGSVR